MDTDDIWDGIFESSGSMERMMEQMFSDIHLHGTDVRTYGYTVYQGPDGSRHVREFGDPFGKGSAEDVAGPLADVSLENGIVRAVAEIPGVSKKDIVLDVKGNTLSIAVDTEQKRYSRVLALPCGVDPDSVKAEYNNGILEVTLATADAPDTDRTCT